jgi:hypothetical protein
MKIIYNQNPLKTIIEFTEEEKKALWLKIKVVFDRVCIMT